MAPKNADLVGRYLHFGLGRTKSIVVSSLNLESRRLYSSGIPKVQGELPCAIGRSLAVRVSISLSQFGSEPPG